MISGIRTQYKGFTQIHAMKTNLSTLLRASLNPLLFPVPTSGKYQSVIFRTGMIAAILLAGLSSCKKNCSSTEAGTFYLQSRGTWRLVKISSPAGIQTVFTPKQTLIVYPNTGRLPGPNTSEKLYSDTTTTAKNDWYTLDVDFVNRSYVVTYDNIPLRRKYWLNENADELQATGYVEQPGSKADTLRYFYVRDK